MDDLIAALEAGPGSRELSDRVLVAVGYRKTSCYGWTRPDGSWPENPSLDPSRNLQDAVDLVPDGLAWDVSQDKRYLAGASASIHEWGIASHEGRAPTPALSLSIANVRAYKAKGDNHEP